MYESPTPPPSFASPADQAEPRRRRAGFAPLAWIVIILTIIAELVLGAVVFAPAGVYYGPDPTAQTLMEIQGRYMVGAAETSGQGPVLYTQARDMLNLGGMDQRLRFVVLAGELAGAAEALDVLDGLHELVENEVDETRGDEAPFTPTEDDLRAMDLLGSIYEAAEVDERIEGDTDSAIVNAADGLTDEERDFLRAHLGWFGDLAAAPSPRQRDAAVGPAQRTFVTVVVMFILGAIALVAGFIGLLIMLALALGGRVKGGLAPGAGHHGIYAETFAIWLLGFMGLQTLAGLLLGSLQAPQGVAMATTLVIFFGSLSVLIWPVARGGLTFRQVREDIGWTSGKVLLEPVFGVAGYIMSLPILGVGLVLTLLLMAVQTAISGPAASPLEAAGGPAHPIIAELAGGNVLVFLMILVLASVAAPIVEETMFRGVLYRHLRDGSRTLGLVGSILLSTLLNTFVFAIIHPQGWVAVPVLAGLATGFTLLREWRRTLIPAMVAHGVSNGIVLSTVAFILA